MSNKPYKCVVVEDEQHTARLMEQYISQMEQLDLEGIFISPLELMNHSSLNEIDIIFLDIQTPNMTGIEFLKSLPVTSQVILTTAYPDYALEGYELNITDYLLKPVDFPRFVKAVNKAIEQITLKAGSEQVSVPAEQKSLSKFLMLKVDKKLARVNMDDIIYIKSDWNYLHFYTLKDKYVVLGTMKKIEAKLSEFQFVRIHKSYLINYDFFEYIEGNMVQVNGIKLQVSRNYKQDLINFLKLHNDLD